MTGTKLVFYLQVEKITPGAMYHVSWDRIESDQTICWGGPRPWRLGAVAEGKFSLEFGDWFGRDVLGCKMGSSKHYNDGWDELI